jgi:hypothetical protein
MATGLMQQPFPGRAEFAPIVRATFGRGCRLTEVRRLTGASKKGVYRLGFGDGGAAIGYVWAESENYWPKAPDEPDPAANPFTDASGAGLFSAAHSLLGSLGVRVPELYSLDCSRAVFPADVALIEYVPGDSLESLLDAGAPEAADVVGRLRTMLDVMHAHRGPGFGKITAVTDGSRSCEQVVLERALAHLAEAADRMPNIGAVRTALDSKLRELAGAIRPRREYGLIHGELGPDHVLVDSASRPVLVDIEGLMFFDVEWEHAFLEMRFRQHYPALRAAGLDEQRLRLYRLAEHLSLVAGPLRLADTDFPDRDFMLEIAHLHAGRAIGYVQPP